MKGSKMKRRENSISRLHHPNQNYECHRGDTQTDKRHQTQTHTRPAIHQLHLQQSNTSANQLVVTSIELLLPLHPLRRWLVISLHHFHLMDSFPQHNHLLINDLSLSPVFVRISSPPKRNASNFSATLPKSHWFSGKRCQRRFQRWGRKTGGILHC